MKRIGYYTKNQYIGFTPYGWMKFPTEKEYDEFIAEEKEHEKHRLQQQKFHTYSS